MPPHLLILQRRATRNVKRARPRSHSHRQSQRERHTAQAWARPGPTRDCVYLCCFVAFLIILTGKRPRGSLDCQV